jgi:hypothetical protein
MQEYQLRDVTSAIMQVRDIDIPEDQELIDIIASQFAIGQWKN